MKKEFSINLGKKSSILTWNKKPLILNIEDYSQHSVIYGTTGSGKTVFLENIQKQLIEQNAGFIYINCKSDIESKNNIYNVCKSIGKENNFYHLDINNPEKSQTINIFNNDKTIIYDFIENILAYEGNRKWYQKTKTLILSLVDLLMILNEENLVFPHKEIKNIKNINDLKKLKNKYTMGFYLIDSYLDTFNILDLIKLFYKLYEQKEAKQYLDILTKNNEKPEIKQSKIHSNLVSSMEKLIELSYIDLVTKTNEEILALNDRTYYYSMLGCDFASEKFKNFKWDYGSMFDSENPEINIIDIINNDNVLYVSLPETATKNNIGLLGKMMVAQIKSAYEKIQSSSLEVPFTVFLDEHQFLGLENIGDLLSQFKRYKRLTFCFLSQAIITNNDENNHYEVEYNVGNKIVLKVEQPQLLNKLTNSFKSIDRKKIMNLEPGQFFVKIGNNKILKYNI